jgi:hypothetical protein
MCCVLAVSVGAWKASPDPIFLITSASVAMDHAFTILIADTETNQSANITHYGYVEYDSGTSGTEYWSDWSPGAATWLHTEEELDLCGPETEYDIWGTHEAAAVQGGYDAAFTHSGGMCPDEPQRRVFKRKKN